MKYREIDGVTYFEGDWRRKKSLRFGFMLGFNVFLSGLIIGAIVQLIYG